MYLQNLLATAANGRDSHATADSAAINSGRSGKLTSSLFQQVTVFMFQSQYINFLTPFNRLTALVTIQTAWFNIKHVRKCLQNVTLLFFLDVIFVDISAKSFSIATHAAGIISTLQTVYNYQGSTAGGLQSDTFDGGAETFLESRLVRLREQSNNSKKLQTHVGVCHYLLTYLLHGAESFLRS